jgi:hypothetical protein
MTNGQKIEEGRLLNGDDDSFVGKHSDVTRKESSKVVGGANLSVRVISCAVNQEKCFEFFGDCSGGVDWKLLVEPFVKLAYLAG